MVHHYYYVLLVKHGCGRRTTDSVWYTNNPVATLDHSCGVLGRDAERQMALLGPIDNKAGAQALAHCLLYGTRG